MSTLPNFTGPGYFAGEAPDGLTTVAGVPVSADVRVYWRDPTDPAAADVPVAQTISAADGTWRITGLNPELQYVVRGRKSGYDDATVVGCYPTRTDVITYEGEFTNSEDFDGVAGEILITSGLPPFTATVIQPLPYGLFPVIDGRKLIVDGTSDDEGVWNSVVRVTASNGVFVDIGFRILVLATPPIEGPHRGAANLESYSAQLFLHPLFDEDNAKWSIAAGKLPAGLHLDPETGVISGVANDSSGYYPVTIMAKSASLSAAREVVIGVGDYSYLAHFTGGHGGTSFPDQTGRDWSRSGTRAYISTDKEVSPGLGSVLYTSGGSHLRRPAEAANDLSVSDWTLELWACKTGSDPYATLLGKRQSGADHIWILRHYSSNNAPFFYFVTTTNQARQLTGPARLNNQWYHWRLSRKGQVVRMWIDGTFCGEVEFTGNIKNYGELRLGDSPSGSWSDDDWDGYMDEFRLVKGAALHWDGDFSPPTSQYEYPVSPLALAVNGSLPAGTSGQPYISTTDITIHGTGPFSVSTTAGGMPDGWTATVNGAHVEVSGPAAAAGSYFFVLTVSDGTNAARLPLTLRVS